MMANKSRRLPCPFCGKARSEVFESARDAYDGPCYFVRCPSCAAQGPTLKVRSEAVRAWDARATGAKTDILKGE